MKVACWNVRTMLNTAYSNRPECRSALIGHELSRLNVDIAALSEVLFPGECSLMLEILSSGQGKLQQRGAFQALVSWSAPPYPPGWKICQQFILTASCPCTFPWINNNKWALFSVDAPTLWAEPAEKDKFYSELSSCLPKHLCIFGDFNTRMGQGADSWKGVLGRQGVANCDDNGRLLQELCTELHLVITNIIF